jgi:ribosomal-protein-alanine N-acetyltransferase
MGEAKIETARLYLRPVSRADLDAFCVLDTDSKVRHFFPEGALTPWHIEQEIERFISEWATFKFGMFSVFAKETDQLIGRGGFAKLQSGEVEMGFLFLKECWGQGYATEVSIALLEWAKTHVPADRIVAFAPLNHLASLRVIEKSGMTFFKEEDYQDIPCAFYEQKM